MPADWSRVMFNKNTSHGNDVIEAAHFFFPFSNTGFSKTFQQKWESKL